MKTPRAKPDASQVEHSHPDWVSLQLVARRTDAQLVRRLLDILRQDSEKAEELRKTLNTTVAKTSAKGFKNFLEEAPLEGIDLERSREPAREPEF